MTYHKSNIYLISFSNCKINIGLYITDKRSDGFHNLETIFFPLPLYDVLEIIDSDKTEITIYGESIPGTKENNIILKAYYLLKKDFPQLTPVHFHLLKNIPVGAGLGAGSANGAIALKALNNKFKLNLSTDQLIDYALQLGSDCPFFILNKPVFATGRGEIFEKILMDLSNYQIVIINPKIHISTPWAFSKIKPNPVEVNLKDAIKQPIENWKTLIKNDFDAAVIESHPEINQIKNKLYKAGADFALMSGSGSTVYGLFKKYKNLSFHFPENYFVKILQNHFLH